MLSYRHAFHAGNFADVLKHATLALVIDALRRKEAGFCYIDTHAGAGRYDLFSEQANKTGEWREGIGRLWNLQDIPQEFDSYLAAVRAVNDEELRYYPGSPRVVRHLLRPQDRMVLLELHTSELPLLQQEFAGDAQVRVEHADCQISLKAYLPPRERRGLVFIDPSYEIKTEYDMVVQLLRESHQRWASGCYAIWYPILNRPSVDRLHRQLRGTGIRKILVAELGIRADNNPGGMNGCGMALVNPPYQLDAQLATLLPWLSRTLGAEEGAACRAEWLAPE
ncbi:MAG: 23S rRNA (adenine(2030)-N(6))-methyltransferase RlmJ [Gammaproteobacteria bacterium]|nr:23S rRNA (adenine(2030)-N(6))-methyltransferase RlmJ [Gammaproteobacteria bacterium]